MSEHEESDRDRRLRLLRLVEFALHTGDLEAARVAWYDLGRDLAHESYLVLRPHDLPVPSGPTATLETLTAWVSSAHNGSMAGGLVFDTVQAVARALLRRELDMEPEA